jgi:hypothetical protein
MRPPPPLTLAMAGLSAVVACAAAAPVAPAPPAPASLAPASLGSAADASTVAAEGLGDAGPGPRSANETDAADAAIAAADASTAASTLAEPQSACNEQVPQAFLIRSNFLHAPGGNARAIQWRTDTYGWFKGFGHPGPDAQPPSANVVGTTFFGLPVRMHKKVVPALKCAEAEIERSCADHPYTPHALAGIRFRNTYRGGEVTNHIYGIAIDIDPSINTCCGCVPPWNDAPRCHRPAKSEYDRMVMPECWVHAFERYGFYWLGHDVLQDTMHFEFLGDPDKIERTPTSPSSPDGG